MVDPKRTGLGRQRSIQILPTGQGIQGEVIGGVKGIMVLALTPFTIAKGSKKANNTKKMVVFFIVLFWVLPLLVFTGLAEPYELIKVLSFICVTNIYLGYRFSLHPSYNIVKGITVLDKILALFLGIIVLSVALNGWTGASLLGQYYRYEGLITLLTLAELYWIVSRWLEQKLVMKIGWVIVSSGLLNSLLMAGQWWWSGGNIRVAGSMGNPNFAGGLVALSSGFLGYIKQPRLRRLFWLMDLLAIIASGSRSALIAFGAVLMLNLGKTLGKKRRYWLIVMILIVVIWVIFPKREASRFDQRQIIWSRAIEAISKKPIFGWGLENFEVAFRSTLKDNDFDLRNIRVDKAHNELLEVATSGGLLALVAYVTLIGRSGWVLWQNRNNNWAKSNLYALVAFGIIASLNVVNVIEYIFLYLTLGVAASFDRKSFDRSLDSEKQEQT